MGRTPKKVRVYPHAKRLADLRRSMGLTQAEMAEESGIPLGNILKAEIGKRRVGLEIMVQLAEFFGTSLEYLLIIDRTEVPEYAIHGSRADRQAI